MTIKINEQKGVLVVRRWKYSPERKRSLPTQVFSVSKYKAPDSLPKEVISEHNVDKEEQATYIDFVTKMKQGMKRTSQEVGLMFLKESLERAKAALLDPELKETLNVNEYEDLSETINEIKKLVTKNKNALKRKAVNSGSD